MTALSSNRFLSAILCLVLLFKAVVPAGFMPDMDALRHGVYKITICSADGAKNIFVDQNQKQIDTGKKQPGHKSEKSGSAFCPFAGIHAAGLPVAVLMLAMLLQWRRLRYPFSANSMRSFHAPVAWPRGPPASLV